MRPAEWGGGVIWLTVQEAYDEVMNHMDELVVFCNQLQKRVVALETELTKQTKGKHYDN